MHISTYDFLINYYTPYPVCSTCLLGFPIRSKSVLPGSLHPTGHKIGYYPPTGSDIATLVHKSDSSLFNSIANNPNHVLHHLLPPKKKTQYNLRPLSHGFTLYPLKITKTLYLECFTQTFINFI